MNQKHRRGLFSSFNTKLALIVTFILIGSFWTINALMVFMVRSDFIRTAENSNFAINTRAAAGIQELLYRIRSEALLLLDIEATEEIDPSITTQVRNIFFDRNTDIAAVIIPGSLEIINNHFFTSNEIPAEAINTWLTGETAAINRACRGEVVLKNASPSFGIHFLALLYPWQNAGSEDAAIIFFSPDSFLKITATGTSSTMVVNSDGEILVHPDFRKVLAGENVSDNPLVESLWKNVEENVRHSYTEGGIRMVGAGHSVAFGNVAVFSFIDYSQTTDQINMVIRRNILLSVTVMFLTILITWFFSRTVTGPVKKLSAAAITVGSGEFNLDLQPESRDEIGQLTERFAHMSQALLKREEKRDLAGRFNKPEMFEMILKDQVNLSVAYRDAVLLTLNFSSFSDCTKDMDAEKSLELLNYFYSRLLFNVDRTGGLIDRFVGTRLIALWGIPLASGNIAADVMSALRAAILIRTELWDINATREGQGLPLLLLTCGVHTGTVLAGPVVTPLNRQYAVAGDVLDDALKAETLCGIEQLDIVITEAVCGIAGNQIIAEEINLPEKTMRLFGLVNLTPANDSEKQRWPFTLNDVRSSLGKKMSR